MIKQLFILLQTIAPQHLLSQLAGYLADCQQPWLKNALIRDFIRRYHVNMAEALHPYPEDYSSFNQFFTRQLQPSCRPLATDPQALASPVDGTVAEIGFIQNNQLLQAKKHEFDLESLLGGKTEVAKPFYQGAYATLYLAPHDYHRVHMPRTGTLTQSIFVPGKLFSVNQTTAEYIPQLYSRNERLICLFDTEVGPMAVILVGAIIVGSIQTCWMKQPFRSRQYVTETHSGITLNKGDELGCFKLGSTVILLFGQDTVSWLPHLTAGSAIQYGTELGKIIKN